MATSLKNLSAYQADTVPDGENLRIALVTAEWNPEITEALRSAAVDALIKHGVVPENIIQSHVPGTYELTSGAQMILEYMEVDAVIVLGCVIQGETRHFDFICQGVTQGTTQLAIDYFTPVIFGVLTTDNQQQALDRAGGKHGNKGTEAAITALRMADLHRKMKPLD
jgi:6,7-dimethyl-8-ribityllumazine synthase